jgi:polyisoprenyl-phosphate glycosyltransferase
VPRLVAQLQRDKATAIVFAERRRRSEGLLFTILYHTYRLMHKVLTGVSVRVGNFSAVPRHLLSSIVAVSELWNHYAAAVVKARLPYTTIPTRRGTRLHGRSSMRFVSLVTHGLSAMSVFGDAIGVRLLIASLAFGVLGALGLMVILYVRLGTRCGAWNVRKILRAN